MKTENEDDSFNMNVRDLKSASESNIEGSVTSLDFPWKADEDCIMKFESNEDAVNDSDIESNRKDLSFQYKNEGGCPVQCGTNKYHGSYTEENNNEISNKKGSIAEEQCFQESPNVSR